MFVYFVIFVTLANRSRRVFFSKSKVSKQSDGDVFIQWNNFDSAADITPVCYLSAPIDLSRWKLERRKSRIKKKFPYSSDWMTECIRWKTRWTGFISSSSSFLINRLYFVLLEIDRLARQNLSVKFDKIVLMWILQYIFCPLNFYQKTSGFCWYFKFPL